MAGSRTFGCPGPLFTARVRGTANAAPFHRPVVHPGMCGQTTDKDLINIYQYLISYFVQLSVCPRPRSQTDRNGYFDRSDEVPRRADTQNCTNGCISLFMYKWTNRTNGRERPNKTWVFGAFLVCPAFVLSPSVDKRAEKRLIRPG